MNYKLRFTLHVCLATFLFVGALGCFTRRFDQRPSSPESTGAKVDRLIDYGAAMGQSNAVVTVTFEVGILNRATILSNGIIQSITEVEK